MASRSPCQATFTTARAGTSLTSSRRTLVMEPAVDRGRARRRRATTRPTARSASVAPSSASERRRGGRPRYSCGASRQNVDADARHHRSVAGDRKGAAAPPEQQTLLLLVRAKAEAPRPPSRNVEPRPKGRSVLARTEQALRADLIRTERVDQTDAGNRLTRRECERQSWSRRSARVDPPQLCDMAVSRSMEPSNCQRGFGASPVEV